MRVAFDAGPLLHEPTGVGRYAKELSSALALRGVDLVRYAVSLTAPRVDGVARWHAPARLAQWSWRRLRFPPIERLVDGVAVVHATNFVLPALARTPGVVTIHDLSFFRSDTFPGGERLRELVPWSVERAARILVPSNAIAAEVRERFGVDEDGVVVTHEGVSPLFFGATRLSDTVLGRMGIPGRFALAIGTIEPRKNLPRLLRAWSAARSVLRDWKLVVAGPRGWGPELPETEDVILVGWVGDETLPGMLAAADVFCYPSLYEGFGLPPLEAMAAGTPALVGDYAAAREVLGDSALIVDAKDEDAIAEGLVGLGTDEALRSRLAVMGRATASTFTWERTAGRTIKAYEQVVE